MKKTEVITFRTDSETKEKLAQIANEKKWSIAQVVDEICKEFFTEQKMKQGRPRDSPTPCNYFSEVLQGINGLHMRTNE